MPDPVSTQINPSDTGRIRLKRRILPPLLLVLAIMTTTAVVSISRMEHAFIAGDIERIQYNTRQVYALSIEKRTEEMAAALDGLMEDQELSAAFRSGNRQALLDLALPAYQRLNGSIDVLQLYFYTPDRRVMLRVHRPDQFGDIVDRQTLVEAAARQSRSQGLEPGPFGSFSLRVVDPWFDNSGRLQGYLEVGIPLESLISSFKFMFDVDPYIFLNKSRINRSQWENYMTDKGRTESWDLLPTAVLIAGPPGPLLDTVLDLIRSRGPEHGFTNLEAVYEDRHYHTGEIPITDASGQDVGRVIMLIDVSDRVASLRRTLYVIGAFGIVINGMLLVFMFIILDKSERLMTHYRDTILQKSSNWEHLQREHIRELEHLALYDPLTDLPNRLLLQDRIDHAIQVAQTEHHTLALSVLNLNRLREINNTLGHQTGDMVLREVADRLQKNVRPEDTIARLGGDEFAILMPEVDSTYAQRAMEKIQEALEDPLDLEGIPISLSSSFGLAFYPDDADDVDQLLQRSDVAMREARRIHRGMAKYHSERDPYNIRNLTLFSDLRRAFNNQELFLEYQPKIRLRDLAVTEVEALVRWHHPTEGLVEPSEFVPLLEKTALINEMTRYVLERALRQFTEWYQHGVDVRIAVNVSMFDLYTTDLSETIKELLDQFKLSPAKLVLEITESAIMEDPSTIISTLNKLNDMGIDMSVDDYGTGYSSLAYLQQLPVKELKIDRSFIADMIRNSNDQVIVNSTIQMAHNLGLKVVAEGVDDRTTWNKLMRMDCDFVQGFYVSKPQSPDQFRSWMEDPRNCQDLR